MKKKLAKLFAGLLAVCTAFSAFACGETGDPTGGGDTPKTDAEKFNAIQTGIGAMQTHEGAYTMSMHTVTQMPDGEGGVQLVTQDQKASFDPETKRAYATQNFVIETYATVEDLEDETAEPVSKQERLDERKVFEKDGSWYRNIYAPYQGTSSSYHQVNKEVAYKLMEQEVSESFNAPFFEQLKAVDYSQMKDAYESVYAEQLAKETDGRGRGRVGYGYA